MLNKNTINILNKNLQKQGIDISFYRRVKNAYNEIDVNSSFLFVGKIKGLFHESENFYNYVNKGDKGQSEDKKVPAILTTYSSKDILSIDDVCDINGTKYKITSFYDIDLSNNFIDISLELIFYE